MHWSVRTGTATRSWVGIGPVFIMLLPLASADLVSRVELTDAGSLAEDDLGIKVGAVSPSGEDIPIAGTNGYAHLLSAKEADNRDMDIELVTGKNATIHDIAWHPRGNTALLVGEEGLAMRATIRTISSVTNVNGSFSSWQIADHRYLAPGVILPTLEPPMAAYGNLQNTPALSDSRTWGPAR